MSVDEKVRIAVRVADLGVHIIEGGFPGSNPKDAEFFRKLQGRPLGDTLMAAFGMTRGKGFTAAKDANLRSLAECWAPVCCIVGKTWDLHVQKVLARGPGREPADDRRVGGLLARTGQAGPLRRGAFLRRLCRSHRLCARVPANGRRGRCRGGHPLRHQWGDVADAGGRGGGARGGGTGRQVPSGHPCPQRRRVCRGQLVGGRHPRRRRGAGDHQRLRGTVRQRRPLRHHPRTSN